MQWYGLGKLTICINKSPGTRLEMLDIDSWPYRPSKLIGSGKCGVDSCCTTSSNDEASFIDILDIPI